VSFEAVV